MREREMSVMEKVCETVRVCLYVWGAGGGGIRERNRVCVRERVYVRQYVCVGGWGVGISERKCEGESLCM